MPSGRAALAGLVLLAFAFCAPRAAAMPARVAGHRAPSGPPLFTESPANGGSGTEASSAGLVSAGDPLVGNGLGSPLCADVEADGLSRAAERNCRTSGFEAAPAPTGNYAFDIHIDTGVIGANGDTLEQDYLISPLWFALVWIAHALIVALEWSYTIDLLNSSAMSGVATGLRAAQRTFTEPWLAIALALASVGALYGGIVRRRVTETLGQALLMVAMMAGGLWVIMNPTGTLGALGLWANQAGLGTLGAVLEGTPAHPGRTLADSMRGVFDAAVGAPWCYMEFGQVRWCEDPARLDPRLRAASQGIAAIEQAQIGCRLPSSPVLVCAPPGSEQARVLSHSVELLRDARTNGDLFLALAANQPARNSINDPGSLLHVLCGGSSEPCSGATAAQAEFRGRSGTQARMGGLLMIAIGALGMVLLLGFIALHLLGAAIVSLFYLLLAPIAVIAPALGDGGRAAFRGWAGRLLGAVAAKLIYSFLLGAVLMMGRILMSLDGLGWWTQWLLVSMLWWSAFRHRHRMLEFARGERESRHPEHRHSFARRLGRALETPRAMLRTAEWARDRFSKPAPTVEHRKALLAVGHERAKERADEQVRRTLEQDNADAGALVVAGPEIQARLTAKRAQLVRVQGARDRALGSGGSPGDTRRAARLGVRAERIARELGDEQRALDAARRSTTAGDRTRKLAGRGRVYTREQEQERGRFLDAQAALPSGTEGARRRGEAGPQASTQRRDYAALAGLAGYGRAEYERLEPRLRRQARTEIDRELAVRRELDGAAKDLAAGAGEGDGLGRRERRKAGKDFERALEDRVGAAGHRSPSNNQESGIDSWLRDARPGRTAPRSTVMDDAREVAARRKRQLGRERR